MWVLLLLVFGTHALEGPAVVHDVPVANKEVCEGVRDQIVSAAPKGVQLQAYCIPRSIHYSWESGVAKPKLPK
jgi:hypothetical protein